MDPGPSALTIAGEKQFGSQALGLVESYFGDDGTGSGPTYTTYEQHEFGWAVQLDMTSGTAMPGSLGVAETTLGGRSAIVASARSRHFCASSGDYVVAGFTDADNTNYSMNVNTASPTPIGPGPTDHGDGWLVKISPSKGYAVEWAYRVSSSDWDAITNTLVLAGGDVVALGSARGDVIHFYHEGGDVQVQAAPATSLQWNGFLARYASDGQAVLWARAVVSDQQQGYCAFADSVADEAGDALYAAGLSGGNVTFDPGGADEATIALGTPATMASYVARFDLSTGVFRWAVPIATPDQVVISMLALEGPCTVSAYLTFNEGATFDLGGPNELTVSAPGQAVHGIARFSTDGRFLGFIEVGRTAATGDFNADVVRASDVQ